MPICEKHGIDGINARGECVDCLNESNSGMMKEKLIADLKDTKWGIPERFRYATLKDFDRSFIPIEFESIFISGPCGTGKTHLAVAIARKIIFEHLKTVPKRGFINFQELAIEVKSSFGGRRTMAEILEDANDSILILDDVGCSKEPPATTIDSLYLIANRRYERCLPTIYTSNLTIAEISQIYGDRIASRLSDCRIITLMGKDRRLEK